MSLGTLVADLGAGVVTIAAAPRGLDVEVGGVAIHDPVDPVVDAGDLVLGVGIDPRSPAAASALAMLGACGAVAVVVKGDPEALTDAARDAGLALLVVPREMAWSQLHTLLRSARVAEGPEAAGADVPVGDLFALANAIASMVGGPTTIEDLHSTVLAYSSLDEPIDEPRRQTILGRRVPEEWIQRLQHDGVFRRLYTSTEPISIDYGDVIDGSANRLAIAVRAGDELLGSIWVAEASRPLGPEAVAALRESAPLAALHLLRTRAAEDLERRRRSDLLRSTLDGRAAPEALVASMGITPATPVTVLAFELLVDEDGPASVSVVERAVSMLTLHCEAYRRTAVAAASGAVVDMVIAEPAPGGGDRSALVRFVGDLAARTTESLRVPLRLAVGGTVAGAADLPSSQREAAAVLRALQADGSSCAVATIDDVRSRVVLHALQDLVTRDPSLRLGKVAALVDHDADRGTDYVATLRAHLDHFGDAAAAASSLHVHTNTFRYRLRRLVEASGLDLDDPVERLVAQLQLTLL
jgi:DNA-binding PucR family transcriptional regulator